MRKFAWISALLAIPGCSTAPSNVTVTVLPVPPSHVEGPDQALTDEEVLELLRGLQYRSLTPGSDHIRGTLDASWDGVGALDLDARGEELERQRHGAASSVIPEYDIDVESFANHERVQYFIDFFQGPARPRFAVWLNRLPRYEGMIRSVFRARGLPEDLVFLGLIESGYSNTAVSISRAVGMWQFMSRTSTAYGLRTDDWVDERRDPFKATDAAARYLSDLHDRFGAWYLAAAAYNGGSGRISRGIRRLRDDSLSDQTFFDLSERRYLRMETRDYVPKLIAATMIAKDPAMYGFDSVTAMEPLAFDEVTVTGSAGLDVLAQLADTATAALVELNPQYYRRITPPGERSVVRVPKGAGTLVALRYAELAESERVNFLQHRIRRGETLGLIGRRYRVTVQLLIAANPGIRPRRLGVGQRIAVPVSSAARNGSVAPLPSARTAPTGGGRYHTVSRGESLWWIGRRYGVSVRDLRRWNDIAPSEYLIVGQRLVVGGGSSVHRVRRGETLWLIAQRYGVETGELRSWNDLESGSIIRAGQRLRIAPRFGE